MAKDVSQGAESGGAENGCSQVFVDVNDDKTELLEHQLPVQMKIDWMLSKQSASDFFARVVSKMATLLKHQRSDVRQAAARAFGEFSEHSTCFATDLLSLFSDSDVGVRESAKRAVKKLDEHAKLATERGQQ